MAITKYTYSVESFIEAGAGVTISYNNLSYIETLSNGTEVPFFNVIQDYIDELKNMSVLVELTDNEFLKYQFKPKLLAHDIYGNPEVYFIILLVNGICDTKDFLKRKLLLLNKSDMEKCLNLIYNAEKKVIDSYNS